jgi:hypothetical protein
MKSKIFIMGAIFVILMFLSLNMAWAHDPTPNYKGNKSHGYGGGNKGSDLTHKGFIPLTKEQKKFERAKRKAWADGRLTYIEMRRLHQLEKKARRDMGRLKNHRVPHHAYKRSHISYRHKWPAYPKFSIMFSFSNPKSHVGGSFGLK